MPGLFSSISGALLYGPSYFIYPGHFSSRSRRDSQSPISYEISYEDLTIQTSDGIKLHAYLFLQYKEANHRHLVAFKHNQNTYHWEHACRRPTVLILHGNAGNIGNCLPHAKHFFEKMKCNVFMLEYRGYGISQGHPSEGGIRLDAQCSLDYISAHEQLSQTPVILYGQSLGGAVAIDLASRNPYQIRALVLENTYLSIPSLIPHCVPLFSVLASQLSVAQKWDSASKIGALPPEIDIMMLSGLKDDIVPPVHMKKLWDLVNEERADENKRRCRYIEFEEGGHNDTSNQPGYWSIVASFVNNLNI